MSEQTRFRITMLLSIILGAAIGLLVAVCTYEAPQKPETQRITCKNCLIARR